jgi:hypothetical protein
MTPVATFAEGGRIAALPMYDLPGLEEQWRDPCGAPQCWRSG